MSSAESTPDNDDPSTHDQERSGDAGATAELSGVKANTGAAAVGSALAVVGVLAAVVAPFLSPFGYGQIWSWLAVLATLAMAAICLLQLRIWRAVGNGDAWVWRWRTPSWAAHLLSYLVALLGFYALIVAMSTTGPGAPSFWLWGVAALGLLGGQASAASQYLREAGPPGTLPAHIRRLLDATSRLGDE